MSFSSISDASQRQSLSSTSSALTTSPSLSTFSRGHSSRSSTSSTSAAPSPIPTRDSFDLYNSSRKLEDVREEPQEREEDWMGMDADQKFSDLSSPISQSASFTESPLHAEYSLGDQDTWSTTSSGHHHFKRQRSTDHRHSLTDRVTSRFGSISRRWKSRSVMAPQLSIVTQVNLPPRSGSAASSSIVSPALSAISKHESHLPTSPANLSMDKLWRESAIVPLYVDEESRQVSAEEEDQGRATTPLLPPMMAELSKPHDTPLQSPLQSPSIAPTSCTVVSRMSIDGAAVLPSPPLSTRPSMASIRRVRADTSTLIIPSEIPYLTLLEVAVDPWDARLGHANFAIHPEPYAPIKVDMDSYKEFRANWEQARKQYAQHIARTMENYGPTSRIYMLTQEKWNGIDDEWKIQDSRLSEVLKPVLARLSAEADGAPDSPMPVHVLEQPVTRIVVPPLDQSGKFPEIGDADIVGPMTMGPAKAIELQRRNPTTPPQSPKKRNLFKYFSDVLGRNHSSHR